MPGAEPSLEQWLASVAGPDWTWFYKRLAANETGATGGHQRGFVIPRAIGRRLFPALSNGAANPAAALPFVLRSHGVICPSARVVHWNQGTRDEYHVTNVGASGSPLLHTANTGRLLVLAMSRAGGRSSAWLARSVSEEQRIESVLGASAKTPAGVFSPAAEMPADHSARTSEPRGSVEGFMPTIPAIRGDVTVPDPSGTAEAFSQSGYRFENAIADLIDNSLDAQAKTVLVRFVTDATTVRTIVIADDGRGMDEDRLREAMRYGGKTDRGPSDLGKYGVGMKSASLSQCRSLSVVSRRGASVVGRRWTEASIRNGWTCEVLDTGPIQQLADLDWGPVSLADHGTLVCWDGLDRLRTERDGVEASLTALFKVLRNHLGLVFHRFLATERIRIILDRVDALTWDGGLASEVVALDPFGYAATGAQGYPATFPIELTGDIALELHAHIWPPNAATPGYRLGGGQVASRQGFYFYRNDRLIQAGGWNGWRDSDNEPHLSLARVAVDLPISADRAFGLSLHKSVIDVPPDFLVALERARSGVLAFKDYIRTADETYRDASAAPGDRLSLPIPGAGLPVTVRAFAREVIAGKDRNVREVRFRWVTTLPPELVFDINRDEDTVELNSRHRATLLAGGRGSPNDAPVVKMLLFVALRQQLARERNSKASVKELAQINLLLLGAMYGTAK